MRKPRDIDAELRALADRRRDLVARKITQLGELVVATGADTLDLETLAGALLAAQQEDRLVQEGWRRSGAEFFQRRSASSRARRSPDGDRRSPVQVRGAGASR